MTKMFEVSPGEENPAYVRVTWNRRFFAERPTEGEAKREIARSLFTQNFTEADHEAGYDEADIDALLVELEEEELEEDTEAEETNLTSIKTTHTDPAVRTLAHTLLKMLKKMDKREKKKGKYSKFS